MAQKTDKKAQEATQNLKQYLLTMSTKSWLWFKNSDAYKCKKIAKYIADSAEIDLTDKKMVAVFKSVSAPIRAQMMKSFNFGKISFRKTATDVLKYGIKTDDTDLLDMFLNLLKVEFNTHKYITDSALQFALELGDDKALTYLIKRPDVHFNKIYDQDHNNLLMQMVVKDNFPAFCVLLKSNEIDVRAKNERGQSVLTLASQLGRNEFVNQLLMHEKVNQSCVINECDYSDKTPLMHAVEKDNIGCVKLLLNNEHTNVVHPRYPKLTLLLRAIELGHIGCVQALFEKLKPEVTHNLEFTHIVISAYKKAGLEYASGFINQANSPKQEQFALEMLDNYMRIEKFDFNKRVFEIKPDLYLKGRYGDNKDTALMMAVKKEDEDCVRFILSDEKLDLTLEDARGMTALDHAKINVFSFGDPISLRRVNIKLMIHNKMKQTGQLEIVQKNKAKKLALKKQALLARQQKNKERA